MITRSNGWAWALGLVAAIAVMAFGITFVLHAGVTGGPFELLMRAGQDRGIEPIATRYALDIGILVAGVGLSGPFGPGTVFYAAVMGIVFRQMQQVLADHRAGREARLADETVHTALDENPELVS